MLCYVILFDSLAVFIFRLYTPTVIGRAIRSLRLQIGVTEPFKSAEPNRNRLGYSRLKKENFVDLRG